MTLNIPNTTRVELPDGRLVTISGGDAQTTANFLSSHYLGQAPVVTGENNVEALPMPTMDFSKPDAVSEEMPNALDQLMNAPDGEEVLPLPTMNFDKKSASATPKPAVSNKDEEVLELPTMNFRTG